VVVVSLDDEYERFLSKERKDLEDLEKDNGDLDDFLFGDEESP
jgi:hypothetical protein